MADVKIKFKDGGSVTIRNAYFQFENNREFLVVYHNPRSSDLPPVYVVARTEISRIWLETEDDQYDKLKKLIEKQKKSIPEVPTVPYDPWYPQPQDPWDYRRGIWPPAWPYRLEDDDPRRWIVKD